MFLIAQKRILELIGKLSDMANIMWQLRDPASAILDCLAALDIIHSQLQQEEAIPGKTIEQLHSIQISLKGFIRNNEPIKESSARMLNTQLLFLKSFFQDEIKAKLNVVFFPYKASMWDSLETVYEAAAKDQNCVVKVVPVPYYQLSQDRKVPLYEGERFPATIPITHYSTYDLEKEQPDIVFLHNIYDQHNTLTQVFETYFTSNLKKYTDMLVYVPYHISSPFRPGKNEIRLAYNLPSIKYVDKVIFAGEFVEKEALKNGLPKDKILTLGSPKFDSILKALNGDVEIPDEWRKIIEGKTVYLLNTGCLYFVTNPFLRTHRFTEFFSIPKIDAASVLIWRPHPLTEASILRYMPGLYEGYMQIKKWIKEADPHCKNIILDETDDYLVTLKIADVLISGGSSILDSYLLTGKKVLFWARKEPETSLLPSNLFYYTHDEQEPWYELIKKFPRGYDPLADNRKGITGKVYTNTDGTCGEKVYQAVKELVLKEKQLQIGRRGLRHFQS
ncbi:MAG: hypothetical protein RBS57_02340 [Desulforhabdus sp.]|jgi:hypothetical protein|nr:hypothetical protein [Desulforhabdus sp.]